MVPFVLKVSQVPHCECEFQMQASNLWQGPSICFFQIFHITTRHKIQSPLSQANIYTNFNLYNCVLLLQDGSTDDDLKSSEHS